MNPLPARHTEPIFDALAVTPGAAPLLRGPGEGTFATAPEAFDLEVRRGSEWIEIALGMPGLAGQGDLAEAAEFHEGLLRWNATAHAGAKIVLASGMRPGVRAELPARASWLNSAWLGRLGEAISSAGRCDPRGWLGAASASAETRATREADPTEPVPAAWTESGWAIRQRSGVWEAELEVPGGEFHAGFDGGPEGSLEGSWRVRVRLAGWGPVSVVCRCAVARLLLLAGGCVRLARPVLWREEEATRAGWEVALPPGAEAADVADALASLSVGCRLVGGALQMLLEEPVAADYLAVTGRADPTPVSSATPS